MRSSSPLMLGRVLFAMLFWIVSYNSTQLNLFVWWIAQDLSTQILVGLVWAGVAGVMLAWSYSAIGKFGFGFITLLIAALLFFFYDQGFITSLSGGFYQNLAPLVLGLINAVALNWNDIRRGGSGSVGVEDPDTD